jgi:hypothetical protein
VSALPLWVQRAFAFPSLPASSYLHMTAGDALPESYTAAFVTPLSWEADPCQYCWPARGPVRYARTGLPLRRGQIVFTRTKSQMNPAHILTVYFSKINFNIIFHCKIRFPQVTYFFGRAIAQAVNRWLPTAATWVRSRIWSSGICGGQRDAADIPQISPSS